MTVVSFRDDDDVDSAAPLVDAHLAKGGVLAHPTETVYGFGCRTESASLSALSQLKQRDAAKPFLLLVATRRMAEDWGIRFTDAAAELVRRFWPGPLTIVLEVTGTRLPDSLKGPTGGVAVRCSSLKTITTLIEKLGYPITSTSANRSGAAAATDVEAVERMFGGEHNLLILDGGKMATVVPSTIVDCTDRTLRVVREGAISLAQLTNPTSREVL